MQSLNANHKTLIYKTSYPKLQIHLSSKKLFDSNVSLFVVYKVTEPFYTTVYCSHRNYGRGF